MTSSSASWSTWRTLYGSIRSGIVGSHADLRERAARAPPARPATGAGRGSATTSRNAAVTGSARIAPSSPASEPPTMIANTTTAGWSWTALPWILGTRRLFSTCWTRKYRRSAARTADRPDGRREQHRRHGRDDRADDRDQLEQPGDHRQQDRVPPEDRVDELAQHDQPDERRDADREAEQDLAADPLPEIALDGLDDRPGVEPPGLRQRPVEGRDQGRLVLEDVGDPDRQDEVGEDRPEEAARPGDEREQERQVGAAAAAARRPGRPRR